MHRGGFAFSHGRPSSVKTRFYWILKALLSHYWRHPWQTLFLGVGLVAGVGLWSAVQIINQHAEASYREAQSLLGAQASYWIRSRRDDGVSQETYIDLRRAGFRQVFPLIELEVSTASGVSISLIATDLLALPDDAYSSADSSDDFSDSWLDFVQPPYRAWVPSTVAAELDLEQGERLELRDGRRLPPALIRRSTSARSAGSTVSSLRACSKASTKPGGTSSDRPPARRRITRCARVWAASQRLKPSLSAAIRNIRS